MKTEEPMKRYPVILSLCSLACCLGSLACGSEQPGLFDEVSLPAQGVNPDEPAPVMMLPPTDVEPNPSEPGATPPDSEVPPDDLPFMMPAPMSPPDPVEPTPMDPPDPPEVEPLRPIIIAVSPEDGATAVDGDTELVIEFSVPMNRELTEAAYQSEGIPSTGVTFSWNEESTVLTITPDEPLEYAVGTDPAEVEALAYSFFLSASAEDAEGNQLAAPEEFSFSVLRQIDVSFFAVQDRDLTGSWRSDGAYGSQQCARNQINMCVGDARVGGDNEQYRGFITFDLSSLPESMARVSAAQLNLQITGMSANPFGGLNGLILEHASFDVIGPDAFGAQALSNLGRIATAGAAGTVVSADVLATVEVDAAERGMTQYRFRFGNATDNDNNSDVILSAWNTQSIELSYLIP
jgi:hypothetical protein